MYFSPLTQANFNNNYINKTILKIVIFAAKKQKNTNKCVFIRLYPYKHIKFQKI